MCETAIREGEHLGLTKRAEAMTTQRYINMASRVDEAVGSSAVPGVLQARTPIECLLNGDPCIGTQNRHRTLHL